MIGRPLDDCDRAAAQCVAHTLALRVLFDSFRAVLSSSRTRTGVRSTAQTADNGARTRQEPAESALKRVLAHRRSGMKPCLDCGALCERSRCPTCDRDRDRVRQVKRGDRYGREHKMLRRRWAPFVALGGVECPKCGTDIEPGEAWDLGHQDDGGASRPEHARCNRDVYGTSYGGR